jgi:glycosyltransferase involved in cell wall biosynthesis
MLAHHGIAPDALVVGFVGRLVLDKGVVELLQAFQRVRTKVPRARLVVVGGGFAGERAEADISEALAQTPGVVMVGAVRDVAPLYAGMDVLAFPSHREGFPNVVLEASAAELPVVGARSTGVVDALVDGSTGTLVDRGDAHALSEALIRYLENPELASAHGLAGRVRVEREFSREAVWAAFRDAYVDRLRARGLPVPA